MRRFSTVLVLLFAFSLSFPLRAAERHAVLDPEATQVSFDLEATGHDVHGTLYLRAGDIRLDDESGTASGELTIDVVRAETGNKKRDKTMHHKVLLSDENPWIVFTPRKMEGTLADSGESEVSLVGTLSLVGVDHPFTLPLTVEVDGGRFTAHTSFAIPYVEWGLKNPSVMFLRVAKEVDVTVEATGEVTAADMTGDGATATTVSRGGQS